MKKIALIGEDPNDTISIKNILSKKHSNQFQYKQLLKNKKGYQLNNDRVNAALKIEYDEYQPDCVLFIRDSDSLPSEKEKIKRIENWFHKLNKIVNNKGLFLLNIYELEALLLADINTFNKIYNTSIKYNKNVMFKKEPKEFLISKTKKLKKTYSESDCPDIFERLNFDLLIKNCSYFSEFYTAFKKAVGLK